MTINRNMHIHENWNKAKVTSALSLHKDSLLSSYDLINKQIINAILNVSPIMSCDKLTPRRAAHCELLKSTFHTVAERKHCFLVLISGIALSQK